MIGNQGFIRKDSAEGRPVSESVIALGVSAIITIECEVLGSFVGDGGFSERDTIGN